MNVVVYGDFNCLLCYLASQRADHLAGTGAAGIEWRAVERGAASARWEQEVAQAAALALPAERLPAAPPPALSSTAAAVAAYAEAITDGIQDELRHRLFDAIWVRRQNLSSAYDVRRVVTAITWPAPPIYFHLASPDLPLPLLHDPDPVRIVRRSGGTVALDGGPLTITGYRRCRDWQEQWLALPRQVTPAVIGPDGTVHVGADGLRCLAAIMATAQLHVLLLGTPRPFTFFAWITGLADVVAAAAPFTQPAPLASKIFTAIINIVVGVAVISLLSGVGRVAIRPAALPTIPDRPVTSR